MTTASDTENIEEVRTNKRSPKGRRRPWKKRMKNVLFFPANLVRKYVFRKNSPRKKPDLRRDIDAQGQLKDAAIESAKRRKIPCYFLFLGLSKSGKSTTISKLFNGDRPKPEDSQTIKVYQNSSVGDEIGLRVVDTPGLLGANTEDQDDRIITAVRSFLRRDIPTRIPTVTFITAPLHVEADEQLTEFNQMLKELTTVRKYITDDSCSNIVLLLTHTQAVEKCAKENVPTMVSKYQEAFSKVFPSAECPVPAITIENFRRTKGEENLKRYHEIIFEALRDFSEQRKVYPLLAMVNWLSGAPRRFSVEFKPESISICNDYDKGGQNFRGDEKMDSESDTDCETKDHLKCEPYFVVYDAQKNQNKKRKKTRKSKKSNKGQVPIEAELDDNTRGPVTCILEGSKILLADKTVVAIQDCLVGEKLLSINPSRPSVITKIAKQNEDDITAMGNAPVGTLYCSVKMSSESDDESRKDEAKTLIYAYQNGSFLAVDATGANVPENVPGASLYFLELDSPDGTFILNGFPCFSKMVNYIS